MKFIPQFEMDDKVIDLNYGYGKVVKVYNNIVYVRFDEGDNSNTYQYHRLYNQYISISTNTSLFSCESTEIKQYRELCEKFPLNSTKFKFNHLYWDIRLNLCGMLMVINDEQIVIRYYDKSCSYCTILRYSRNHYPQVLFDNDDVAMFPDLKNYKLCLDKLTDEHLKFNIGDVAFTKNKDTKLCGKIFSIDYLPKPVEVTIVTSTGMFHKCNINNLQLGESMSMDNNININKFKSFDRVLVRNRDDEQWYINFFSHYYSDKDTTFYCCWDRVGYLQCIPYEGNEKLVGTMDEPR